MYTIEELNEIAERGGEEAILEANSNIEDEKDNSIHDDYWNNENEDNYTDEEVDITILAFKGEYPLSVILESIDNQFVDYINLEDKNNYVDIFYNQYDNSLTLLEDEPNRDLYEEALDKVLSIFISHLYQLFSKRLTIGITTIESEEMNYEQIEFVFRKLYEVFILNARQNFMKVISQDINSKINKIIEDDNEYFEMIEDMLSNYSPLILEIGPMEFLRYIDDGELFEIFSSGMCNGNFLRRYTPRLYQNEEFKIEIINAIVLREV